MTSPVRSDRRHLRRRETIEQVLDTAVAVMAHQGVAGLTLGEVARRMGIRPPSLYMYFDGKLALYDALFERGWRELSATMHDTYATTGDLVASLFDGSAAFVRWAVEHPAYAPRPTPVLSSGRLAVRPQTRTSWKWSPVSLRGCLFRSYRGSADIPTGSGTCDAISQSTAVDWPRWSPSAWRMGDTRSGPGCAVDAPTEVVQRPAEDLDPGPGQDHKAVPTVAACMAQALLRHPI